MGSKSTVCHDDVDDKKFPVQCITQKACPYVVSEIYSDKMCLEKLWMKTGYKGSPNFVISQFMIPTIS